MSQNLSQNNTPSKSMPPKLNSKPVPFSMSQTIVVAKPHSYLSPMHQFLNFGLRLRDYNTEIKVNYSHFYCGLMCLLII